MQQVCRRERLELRTRELADLERDLERGAVVDSPGNDAPALHLAIAVEHAGGSQGPFDLLAHLLRHRAQVVETLRGGRGREQCDCGDRVEVRLGGRHCTLLARVQLEDGVGGKRQRRLRVVGNSERGAALLSRLVENGDDIR